MVGLHQLLIQPKLIAAAVKLCKAGASLPADAQSAERVRSWVRTASGGTTPPDPQAAQQAAQQSDIVAHPKTAKVGVGAEVGFTPRHIPTEDGLLFQWVAIRSGEPDPPRGMIASTRFPYWGHTFEEAGTFVVLFQAFRPHEAAAVYTARYTMEVFPIEALADPAFDATKHVLRLDQVQFLSERIAEMTTPAVRPPITGPGGARVVGSLHNPSPPTDSGSYSLDPVPAGTNPEALFWYERIVDGPGALGQPAAPTYVGKGTGVHIPMKRLGVCEITCVEGEPGKPPQQSGTPGHMVAQFFQTVVEKDAIKQGEALRETVETNQREGARIVPYQRQDLRAIYLSRDTGQGVPLNLFLGPSIEDPSRTTLIDLTPGATRSHYEGATPNAALDAFQDGQAYPAGMIELEYRQPDGSTRRRRIKTDGETKKGHLASKFAAATSGMAGLSWLLAEVAELLPLLIPGVDVAYAAALLAAAAGYIYTASTVPLVASIGLDVSDQFDKNHPSLPMLAVDILRSAAALLLPAAKAAVGTGAKFVVSRGTQRFIGFSRLGLNAAPDLLMTFKQYEQLEKVAKSDLPEGQKQEVLFCLLAALARTGTGVYLLTDQAVRLRPDSLDTAFGRGVFGLDEALPDPTLQYWRPREESAPKSEADPAAKEPGAAGPGIVSSVTGKTNPGRAPTVKAGHYFLTAGPRSPRRQWYALCQREAIMARRYYGYNLEAVRPEFSGLHAGGQPLAGRNAYNLGTDETAYFALMTQNVYTIVCIELDADGRPIDPVHAFQQLVQGPAA
jgi:hypothetical protein